MLNAFASRGTKQTARRAACPSGCRQNAALALLQALAVLQYGLRLAPSDHRHFGGNAVTGVMRRLLKSRRVGLCHYLSSEMTEIYADIGTMLPGPTAWIGRLDRIFCGVRVRSFGAR